MGIPGLLKELNALVGRDAHVSEYQGQRVAVDASGWLHRSTYSCALDLVLGRDTSAYLSVLRGLLAVLLDHAVVPVVVFDGAQLPAKAATNAAREAARARHRLLALHFHRQQPPQAELALQHAQRAVSVTPALTASFIALCRELSVELVVAPYEADAQLSRLVQSGDVRAVVSEDSDLFPFGCDRLFIQLDRSGAGRELCLSDVVLRPPVSPFHRRLQSIVLDGDLLPYCVLSGCDYLPSLRGMGCRTAAKWWSRYHCIELVTHHLKRRQSAGGARKGGRKRKAERRKGKEEKEGEGEAAVSAIDVEVDEEAEAEVSEEEAVAVGKAELTAAYALDFHRAVLCFRHQLVYDRSLQRYDHLHPLPPQLQPLSQLSHCHPSPPASASVPDPSDPSVPLHHRLSLSSHHNGRLTSLDFLGLPPPVHLTQALVTGQLDPSTLKPWGGEQEASSSIHRFFAPAKTKADRGGGREEGREQSGPAPIDRVGLLDFVDGSTAPATSASSPLQAQEWTSSPFSSSASPDAVAAAQRQRSVGGGRVAAQSRGGGSGSNWRAQQRSPATGKARAKTRSEVVRERMDEEDKRSTRGGLLHWIKTPTAALETPSGEGSTMTNTAASFAAA